MKPNNLLLAADGQLKLGDFGLARIFGSPDRRFTHQVSVVDIIDILLMLVAIYNLNRDGVPWVH